MDPKKARKALRRSIKHWCIDIRKPLLDGDSINASDWHPSWVQTNKMVKCSGHYCDICRLSPTCGSCPLENIGEQCDNKFSAYGRFWSNPNIDTTNNMISALIQCYKEASDG